MPRSLEKILIPSMGCVVRLFAGVMATGIAATEGC
jgi:hypothetical protein